MNSNITDYFLPETPRSEKRKVRSRSSPYLNCETTKKQQTESVGTELLEKMATVKDMPIADFFKKLDEKIEKLATKEDIKLLQVSIESLKHENELLKLEISNLKKREAETSKLIDDVVNRSMRNNVIFKGLKTTGQDYENTIKDFCINTLSCNNDIFINRAHPLRTFTKDGIPPIIAHIPRDRDISAIFRNVKNLRGTGFVVHRDYSRNVRSKRYNLLQIKKKAEEVSRNARTNLVFDHLYIDGKRFDWTLEHGLMCGDTDGNTVLKAALGYDFGPLISDLMKKASYPHPPVLTTKNL